MTNLPLKKAYNKFISNTNLRDCFQFNEFSEDIEFRIKPEWNNNAYKGKRIIDDDITLLRLYLTSVHDLEPNRTIVGELCYIVSQLYKYHPVKEYIENEKWDGINRIDTWMIESFGCKDNPYIKDVSSKFLIAAINRIYNPGCKFDNMLILEGDQGIGKSTVVEELAGDFFLDTSFDNKDKDLIDSMNTAFIIEISELSGMTKKDLDWMKSFLKRKVDRVRLAYAHRTKDFKRKSVFVGTYNPSGNNTYLRDDTGNRIYWPVECAFAKVQYIRENKKQLWAEAYQRYQKKEKYYLESEESIKILKNLHAEREFHGPNQLKLEEYLSNIQKSEVTTMELLEKCLHITTTDDKILGRAYSIMGIQLKRMGWKKGIGIDKNKYYNPKHINKIEDETQWEE